jgi:hypothetical protein
MFVYIFVNSKITATNKNTQKMPRCNRVNLHLRAGEKYKKSLLGIGNSLTILNRFVDSGRNEENNWNSDI